MARELSLFRLQCCILFHSIETGTVAVVPEVTMTDNAGPGIRFAFRVSLTFGSCR